MSYKIGFRIGFKDNDYKKDTVAEKVNAPETTPRKSLVSVRFDSQNRTYSYYNDKFDLKKGDIVFVEGKLEGVRGIVVEVNYNFKIKLSDYKKVIAVADTKVSGELFFAGSHFVVFDKSIIPFDKVITWYKAPAKPDDEIICSSDDKEKFLLENLKGMKVSYDIEQRGYDYYLMNKVVYISVDGNEGKAIVEGTVPYEVNFSYNNGEISKLTCECYCNYTCKHQVATMYQLQDILKSITRNYADMYEKSNYFAAICKQALFHVAVDFGGKGSLIFK